jgi:hypothetical protein
MLTKKRKQEKEKGRVVQQKSKQKILQDSDIMWMLKRRLRFEGLEADFMLIAFWG